MTSTPVIVTIRMPNGEIAEQVFESEAAWLVEKTRLEAESGQQLPEPTRTVIMPPKKEDMS